MLLPALRAATSLIIKHECFAILSELSFSERQETESCEEMSFSPFFIFSDFKYFYLVILVVTEAT
jgi:hypothetical protein